MCFRTYVGAGKSVTLLGHIYIAFCYNRDVLVNFSRYCNKTLNAWLTLVFVMHLVLHHTQLCFVGYLCFSYAYHTQEVKR